VSKNVVHADAALAAGAQHVFRVDAKGRLHLGDNVIRPGDGQVDLVEDWHDGQVAFDGEVGVGDGLGLDALEGVHEEDDALAGGEAARDLVVEIDVAGRVDEV
jgi:hypothetical protein